MGGGLPLYANHAEKFGHKSCELTMQVGRGRVFMFNCSFHSTKCKCKKVC